jgi:probable rRNA maturation factor
VFNELVKKIIRAEKASGIIDVSLVNDEQIKVLNQKYRKKNRPTDVLAFPYGKSEGKNAIIGDVIISLPTARRNARRFGVGPKTELKRLIIHGTLHVLGYDHGKRMSNAEKIYSQY